ncbi:hypothetical protein HZF02_01890 [Pseudomonas yamanorum]|nr:hypothetical protein HZF02_01890 [Pseudomonas yamanorum]
MKITLYQVLSDEMIEASVSGDVITINGEAIDLSVIPDGYKLPASAANNPWFVNGDYIQRVNGVFEFSLRFPVKWDSPDEVRAPDTPIILDVKSGKVRFPSVEPLTND